MMDEHPVIFFDGECNFCNATVNLIIRNDRDKLFRFASLQSEKAKAILHTHYQNIPDSFILLDKGRFFKSSTAALKLFNKLPWYWKWTQLFWVLPRSIRDALYDLFAKFRYRLFGKRPSCMLPTPDIKDRFL